MLLNNMEVYQLVLQNRETGFHTDFVVGSFVGYRMFWALEKDL